MYKLFENKLNDKQITICLIFLILILSYFVLFFKLGSPSLDIWDEARNAINALEMSESNNYFITTFNGQPDLWNTKPPLLIIVQSFFIKLFGLNELSVRLPSAIACLITVFTIFIFIKKYIKSNFIAFFSCFVLLTSPGLIAHHGVRTGDFEATLILFCTAYSLFYLSYIETNKIKFLYLFSVAFTLAFMTKSSAALMFLPGLLIYTLYRKKLKSIFCSKHFYLSLALPVITIGSYYLYREITDPGYLKIIYENEFGGRFLSVIENHENKLLYYFNILVSSRLKYWFWIIPLGVILTFFEKNTTIKRLFIFSGLLATTHLIFISLAQTKLHWYALPEYPFWSIMSAITIYQVLNLITGLMKKHYAKNILTTVIIIPVVLFPIFDTLKRINNFDQEIIPNNAKVFLRDELRPLIDKDSEVTIITTMYPQNIIFYLHIFEREGYNIKIGNVNDIAKDKLILLDEYEINKSLVESVNVCYFTFPVKEYNKSIVLYKMGERRNYEESINYATSQILSSDQLAKDISEKAEINSLSFEEQLMIEADLIVQNSLSNLNLN